MWIDRDHSRLFSFTNTLRNAIYVPHFLPSLSLPHPASLPYGFVLLVLAPTIYNILPSFLRNPFLLIFLLFFSWQMWFLLDEQSSAPTRLFLVSEQILSFFLSRNTFLNMNIISFGFVYQKSVLNISFNDLLCSFSILKCHMADSDVIPHSEFLRSWGYLAAWWSSWWFFYWQRSWSRWTWPRCPSSPSRWSK